jgi:hypothetical protein
MNWIRSFDDVGMADVASVGGKNASLGEMRRALTRLGIRTPDGFATTADAYRAFMRGALRISTSATSALCKEQVPGFGRRFWLHACPPSSFFGASIAAGTHRDGRLKDRDSRTRRIAQRRGTFSAFVGQPRALPGAADRSKRACPCCEADGAHR